VTDFLGCLVPFALLFAGIPCLLYFRNVVLFHKPVALPTAVPERISVLIPARNEEAGIAAALEAVLANEGVELEVIVLDDGSTDRTAEIVTGLAASDTRVTLVTAPPPPDGWCGKQHACLRLSELAKYEVITFLDADVRLGPHALKRMAGFLRSSGASLVSGFPRQETCTLGEKLILPLINWLLLCYLPLKRMRASLQVALGAGCGQWFMTTAVDYRTVGGHGHPLVKGSLHDGVKLPRAYRRCGLKTDLCDASDDAICRMYRSAGQVWNGFAKNAREGLGAPGLIWIWTVLLAVGHIGPFALLYNFDLFRYPPFAPAPSMFYAPHWPWILLAIGLSLAPRIHAAIRFRQSWLGVILHPVAILALLAIQWYATLKVWMGHPVGWKGRTPPMLSSDVVGEEPAV
jgi:glycosyltransferase involved in cell wall biosynthesis